MSDYSENNRTNYNEIHEEGLEKVKTAIKAAKDVKRANRRAKRPAARRQKEKKRQISLSVRLLPW